MPERLVIDNVRPRTPTGRYPAKAAVGDVVPVSAWIMRAGHDQLAARVQWRPAADAGAGAPERDWDHRPLAEEGNDEWAGSFEPAEVGLHELRIEAWADHLGSWAHDVRIKHDIGDDVTLELEEGARICERLAAVAATSAFGPVRAVDLLRSAAKGLRRTGCSVAVRLAAGLDPAVVALGSVIPDPYDREVSPAQPLWVDRPRARFSAWYELFPRSEGGLTGARKRLAAIAEMGFDVVYLPPIHPIGTTARKGRNNTLASGPDDPGSPWAIGSVEGGHTVIAADLGTDADFDAFCADAAALGMEVALDYALQCSPDHPWVSEHPEWFVHRPDGTIRYAENPPKKYQDIYPIDFWPKRPDGTPDEPARQALWQACKDILDHWIDRGIRIFRVDNPHTKPMSFWAWLIPALRAEHPDVILLSEAFTRPKVMAKLAEVGFTQSYTYFTWRTSSAELRDYLTELAAPASADCFRPNFWPNTPDILSGPLRHGNRAAFKLRALLAALTSPNWGLYSGYELCENQPASDENEEYLHSEKYEIKHRNWDDPDSLAPWLGELNRIRRDHPAFAELRTIRLCGTDNEALLAFTKTDGHGGDPVLVVVNLDPIQAQAATLWVDLDAVGMPHDAGYDAYDELSGQTFDWYGSNPWVRLDPAEEVAHVLSLRRRS